MGSSEGAWLGRRVTSLEQLREGNRVGEDYVGNDNDDDTQEVDADIAGGVPFATLWKERDEVQVLLREVLAPFVDRLKHDHRKLIEALFYERLTEERVAELFGVDRSTISRRKDTALRALVRELALFDDGFRMYDASLHTGRRGRPARDYDAEADAAWAVLRDLLSAGAR